jgi:hypothetical protein
MFAKYVDIDTSLMTYEDPAADERATADELIKVALIKRKFSRARPAADEEEFPEWFSREVAGHVERNGKRPEVWAKFFKERPDLRPLASSAKIETHLLSEFGKWAVRAVADK